MLLALALVTSCATNHLKDQIVTEQEIVEDTYKEDKILGDSLPSWTRKSGIENGMVYVVGKAEMGKDRSPFYVEDAARMKAEMRLFSDAPADIRILAQNAMTGVGIDSAEFYQIQTKLQTVVGVTGMKFDSDKVTCRQIIRYGELSTRRTRACWVQAHIPVTELVKAYRRTLALQFGEYKASEFKNKMDDELKKINNNPLMEKRNEKANTLPTSFNNSGDSNGRESVRLPAKEAKENQKQSEVSDTNGKSRQPRTSRTKAKNSNASSGRVSSGNQVKGSSEAKRQKLSERSTIVENIKGKRGSMAQVQL